MNDPAFLFYPGDYLRDTQTLSEKSQVAYDRIMCEHMRNICISKTQLKFFTKKLNEEELEELMFVLNEIKGGFQIKWVSESIIKRRKYSESRRNNRKSKNKKDMLTYDEHMENEIENEIENKKEEEMYNEESKKHTIEFLCKQFGISEQNNFQSFKKINEIVSINYAKGEEGFRHFKNQCWNCLKFKAISKQFPYSLDSFIGTKEENYEDGKWNSEDWGKKGKEYVENNNLVEPKKVYPGSFVKRKKEPDLLKEINKKIESGKDKSYKN